LEYYESVILMISQRILTLVGLKLILLYLLGINSTI